MFTRFAEMLRGIINKQWENLLVDAEHAVSAFLDTHSSNAQMETEAGPYRQGLNFTSRAKDCDP